MKAACFYIFVLVIAASRAALSRDKYGEKLSLLVDSVHDHCLEESSVDPEDIVKSGEGHFNEDIKFKKYIFCWYTYLGGMDKVTGELNIKRVEELAPPQLKDQILEILADCKKSAPEFKELYEKTFYLQKCYYEKDPTNYVLF